MAEATRKAETRENIFRLARILGADIDEYLMSQGPHLSGHRSIIEMASELPEVKNIMEKVQKPVFVELGGWNGRILDTIEKKYPAKEITRINLDYNLAGLKGSRDDRLLADMANVSMKNNSADVVYITNFLSDISHIIEAVEGYPVSMKETYSGSAERIEILDNLEDITQVQEDIVRLEAIRVLKKGGVLIEGGGYSNEQLEHAKITRDPTATGILERRTLKSEKVHDRGHEENALMIAYEKTKDADIERIIAEKRRHLNMLVDKLEGYDYKGGLLDRVIKHAKQKNAEELARKGKVEGAVAEFDEIIDRDRDYAKAWLGKADTLNAIARYHETVIGLMKTSFQNELVPEEKFSSDLSNREKALSLAAFSASRCYREVIKILEEGRDSSRIEHPNEVIRSCHDKLSVIFNSRNL